jgi:hypothetical protein
LCVVRPLLGHRALSRASPPPRLPLPPGARASAGARSSLRPPSQLAHARARTFRISRARSPAVTGGVLPPPAAGAQVLEQQPARRLDPVATRPADGARQLVRRAPARCSAIAPSRTPAHRLACRRRPQLARPPALARSSLRPPSQLAHARTFCFLHLTRARRRAAAALRRYLNNNQLVDSIPSQLGHMTALKGLCVVRPHAARPSRPLARQAHRQACRRRPARVRPSALALTSSHIKYARTRPPPYSRALWRIAAVCTIASSGTCPPTTSLDRCRRSSTC